MSKTVTGSGIDEAKQEIVDYIRQFAPLSDHEIEAIMDSMQLKHYPKGTFILKDGQTKTYCHFVLKGCIRQYYLVDGLEKTTHFYTEGEPIATYDGMYQNKPAKFNLICMEDCIVTSGNEGSEKMLFAQFPHFEAISRRAVEDELAKKQVRLDAQIIHSPEERYLQLLETRPDLIDRVPQYHLASYLGVTPESLSRIRKRIMAR